jgi:RNA polymerase sigma-70 factor, ECF subfamily
MTTQAMPKAVDYRTDTELIEAVRPGDVRALEAQMRRHDRSGGRRAGSVSGRLPGPCRLPRRGEALAMAGADRGERGAQAAPASRRTAAVVPMDAAAAPSEERNSLMSDRPGPEQDASRAEMRRLIEARIDALPDSYRAVFVLRALEELTVEETAGVLEIPEAAVRTRFSRARALLREALAQQVDRGLEEAFGFAGERCDRIVANFLAAVKRSTA